MKNEDINNSITEALIKFKKEEDKEPTKEGVSLLDITKKLSSRKFDNKK